MRSEDAGTVIPLVLLCFLLAGTLVTAGIAASAAFLAQRDLAGICDGAAVAAAAGAVDRTALAARPDGVPGPALTGALAGRSPRCRSTPPPSQRPSRTTAAAPAGTAWRWRRRRTAAPSP